MSAVTCIEDTGSRMSWVSCWEDGLALQASIPRRRVRAAHLWTGSRAVLVELGNDGDPVRRRLSLLLAAAELARDATRRPIGCTLVPAL